MNKRFCLAVTVVFSILFCGMLIFLGWANAANCGDGVGACACGDTLTANYTLSADLNCTNAGPGLWVGANDITLDLGGYTIDGDLTNTTRGVWLSNGTTGVTIQGPGTIQDFKTAGVYGQTVAGDATLYLLDLTVQNLTIQNIYDGGVGSSTGIFNIGKGFTATNVTMTNIGTDGIQTAGDDFTITNNNISTVSVDDTNGDCVQVGTHGDNGLISGNTLDHSSKDSKQTLIINVGTTAGDTETIVEDNTFIGYDGASTMQTVFIDYESSSAALIFRRNKVYYGNYNLYVTTSKIDVYNNIFYKPTAMGIVFDSGSLANLLYNNNMISGGSGTRGLHINGADDVGVTFKNNIFHGFSDSGDYGVYTNSGTYTESNNLYYDCDTNFQGGSTTNAVTSDPLFTDATGLDFTISASSPAIDAGLDVALRTDYLENPVCEWPDIGAYEYQKTPAYMRFRVDDDAGSSGIGSVTDPWDAVADVNAYTFYGSDYVVFDKGDTWREQLTVPSSGSSGSPITFAAYGTGDDPIISGAELVTPGSSWTEVAVSPLVEDTFETGSPDAFWSASAGTVVGGSVMTGTYSYLTDASGESIQKTSGLGGTYYVVQFDLRIDSSSSPTSGHKARFDIFKTDPDYICLWLSYSGTTYYIGANTNTGSAAGTFAISTDTTYAIEMVVDVSGNAWSLSVDDSVKDSGAVTFSQIDEIKIGHDGYNPTSFVTNLDDITIYNTDPDGSSNKWLKAGAVATEPHVLSFDGVKGTYESGGTASLNAEYEWFWGSNTVYVYSTTDPDTAYTSPGIEYGQRDTAVDVGANDYLDFNGFIFKHGNDDGTDSESLVTVTAGSTNVNFTDCQFLFGAYTGLFFDSDSGVLTNLIIDGFEYIGIDLDSGNDMILQDSTIRNCTNSDNLAYCVYIGALTPTADNVIIRRNTIYDCNSGITIDNASAPIVQDNEIYRTDAVMWNGIYVKGNTSGVANFVIKENYIYDIAGQKGIDIDEDNTGAVTGDAMYNLLVDNAIGIRIRRGAVANIYNNTLYSNSSYAVQVDDANTNANIKNNILSENGTEMRVEADVDQAVDIDYNQYYHSAGGTPYHWKGTDYNFADWKTNSSQDAASLNSDPLFTNATGADFRLTPTSPARGVATDVWTGEASIESYNGVDVTDAAGVLKNNLKSKIDIGANQGVYVPLFPVFGIFFGENWVQPQ